jgi:hypothetical protein
METASEGGTDVDAIVCSGELFTTSTDHRERPENTHYLVVEWG